MNHGWQWLREKLGLEARGDGARSRIGRAAGVALTLLCVMVGWVFFRAAGHRLGHGILREHVRLGDDGLPPGALAGYSHGLLAWIAVFSLFALFGRNSQASHRRTHLTRWLDRRASERVRYAELLAMHGGRVVRGVVLMAIAAARARSPNSSTSTSDMP